MVAFVRGWRVLVALVVVVMAGGCDATERLEIRADGSATVATSLTVGRDDPLLDFVPLVEYDEWTALAREDERTFLEEMLALESADPILDQFEVEVGQEQTTITVTHDVDTLDELVEVLAASVGPFASPSASPVLAGSVINEADAGITLTVDAVGNLIDYWAGVLALEEGASLFDSVQPLDDLEPMRGSTHAVELKLPGRIVEHDAHQISENTLRWTWTIGEQSRPGITVTWDPADDSNSGFIWSGRGAVTLYGLVALLGLAALILALARRRPAGAEETQSSG